MNQLAETAKLFVKFGFLHIISSSSADLIEKRTFEMNFIESIFEFSRNLTYIKEIAALNLIQLMHKKYFDISIDNKENKQYFETLIKKMISSQLINNSTKVSLKKESSNFNINIL